MVHKLSLIPKSMCETLSGDLAYILGRLAFRPGRPMLVEHLGGVYLEHDLSGRILTEGYGREYDIMHIWEERAAALSLPQKERKVFLSVRSQYCHSLR